MPLQITWISVSFVICTLRTISTQYCPDGEFTCTDGQCIEHDRSCDGKVDCSDGIDEFGCGDPEPLPTSTTSRNTDSAYTNENGSTHLMPTSSTTRNTDSATMSESGSTHLMPTSTTSRNTDSSPTSESGSTHLMPTTTTSSNTNSATTSENGSTHLMQTSSTSRNTDSALTSESGSTDLMPTSTTSRNTDSPPTSDSRDPDPLPTSTTSRYTDSAITNESVTLPPLTLPPIVDGCDKAKIDLIFVLDASTSMTEPNFLLMKNFVKDFLSIADIDNGNVLVGIVIYSKEVFVQFQLNSYNTKVQVFEAVDNIRYRSGDTNTADGLNTMRTQMFTASNGDRPDVQNIAIVITDGISNINSRRTIPEAEQARAEGIHIFAIGIGLTDTTELDGIASKPVDENRFAVKEFSELRVLRDKVFEAFCPRSTHLMPTTTTSSNTDSATTSENGSTHLMSTSTTSRNTDSAPTSDSGPPNITMDEGKIYFARVDEPFTVQFQVESYYSSHVSNVSVVGKDGIERILHEIVDWTQNSTQNVKDIKLFNITLTIVNVTSSITNSKFFVTVRNERGSASASFMLEEKGTATTSNANTESTVENKSGLRGDETSPLIFIIAITIPAVVIGFIVLFVVFRKHKCKSYNMPGIKDSGGESISPTQDVQV